MTDQEYLNNDIIPDVNFLITDDNIKITSASTLYCNISKITDMITIKDIKQLCLNITKLAKQQNCKVSTKYKKRQSMLNNYELYITELNEVNKAFNKAIPIAQQLQKRQLHYGTTNDIVLNELHSTTKIFQQYYHRDKAYSIVTETFYSLKKLYEDMQNNIYEKIYM